MKEVYQQTKLELFETYGSPSGHSEEEAKAFLQQYGENVLAEKGKKSVLRVFLGQFADLLVVILLAAAVISMLSGNAESTIVIFTVLILNAVLGTVQYVKAEKSLDSLKELSAPRAKVLRDGMKKEVAAKVMEIFKDDLYNKTPTLDETDSMSALVTFILMGGEEIEKKKKKRGKK